jgi:hypothetical protein
MSIGNQIPGVSDNAEEGIKNRYKILCKKYQSDMNDEK